MLGLTEIKNNVHIDNCMPMVYYLIMTSKDLKTWRAENVYTQKQLADALGVAIMTVSRWETGLREIPSYLHLALECLKAKGGELRASKGMKTKKERR